MRQTPPGFRHAPASALGAVILVKLRQMPAEETEAVRLDTRDPALWCDLSQGRQEAVLFDAPWGLVVMLRLAAGHAGAVETCLALAREAAARGADVVVLEARRRMGGRVLSHRTEAGSHDLGPAWVWPAIQPRIARVMRAARLALPGLVARQLGTQFGAEAARPPPSSATISASIRESKVRGRAGDGPTCRLLRLLTLSCSLGDQRT